MLRLTRFRIFGWTMLLRNPWFHDLGGDRSHPPTLERAKLELAAQLSGVGIERIIAGLERLIREEKYLDRLAVPKSGRLLFVPVKDIDWIEAKRNYVRLHVGKQTYEWRETLSELEDKLGRAVFLRIHRSTLVNVERIKEISGPAAGTSIA